MIEPAVALLCSTVNVASATMSDPSVAMAVMVTSPSSRVVTRPFWSTVATSVLLLVQSSFLMVASAGVTVAVSWRVSPTTSVPPSGVRAIEVTGVTSP